MDFRKIDDWILCHRAKYMIALILLTAFNLIFTAISLSIILLLPQLR